MDKKASLPDPMTVAQAAEFLAVSRWRVHQLMRSGRLTYTRDRFRYLLDLATVKAFEAGRDERGNARGASRYRRSDRARFMTFVHVRKPHLCWLWTGATSYGYGSFGANGKVVPAHVFAYEHFRGPIMPELTVDHLCKVHACVNPNHLQLVTRAENSRLGHDGETRSSFNRKPKPGDSQ